MIMLNLLVIAYLLNGLVNGLKFGTDCLLEIGVVQTQLLGWFVIVYGLTLLRGAFNKSSQWEGWTHILFGALIVNLTDINHILASILGRSPMSVTCGWEKLYGSSTLFHAINAVLTLAFIVTAAKVLVDKRTQTKHE
jgi:uncharacterized membrane protein HdeD (DUF308 family)